MLRNPVRSSNIKSVGYDAQALVLEVEFSSGTVYQYAGVPASIYDEMMASDSIGSYFARNVRGDFEGRKVGNDDRG